MAFSLIRCDASGMLVDPVAVLPDQIKENCLLSAGLYASIGFVVPWVSYVAVDDGRAVGGGAFVGAPKENRVEIAYFTSVGCEGKGHATNTAECLMEIARAAIPNIVLTAHTLPEHNASTTILEKLGFIFSGSTEDVDAGVVWLWSV
jgi:ribosomal-protein-alanine N-acetyltransferase